MDFIFEFVLELILEGSIEASKCRSIPKVIRYSLILFILSFFVFIISVVFLTGVLLIKDSLFGGLFIIFIGGFLLVSCVNKFRNVYLNRSDK